MSPVCKRDKPIRRCPIIRRPRRALLVRERQELDCKLTHHVAVERHKVRNPKAVKNGEQQQRIFGRLSERLGLFDQETRPLNGSPGFRRRVAPDMEQRGDELDLKPDLFAAQAGRAGQARDEVERAPELFRRFHQGRALRRPPTRLSPTAPPLFRYSRLGAVSRQQLGLVLGDLAKLALEGRGNSSMKLASRLAQQ